MKNRISITSFDLRVIAIMTMIIDHIGAVFFPSVMIYRIIGRISFPIFAFLIVEGSFHTTNIKAYMKRLLCFAVISEIPFNLAFRRSYIYMGSTNVLFTLYAGVLIIDLIKSKHRNYKTWFKLLLTVMIIQFIGADYQIYGILTVIIFYSYRGQLGKIYMALCFVFIFLMGGLQKYALLSFIFLYFYNGREGKKLGRLFYLVYPLHLVVIYLVYLLK